MFCKNCGVLLAEGTVFCPECGTKQEVEEKIIDVDEGDLHQVPEVEKKDESQEQKAEQQPVQEETSVVNSLISTEKIKYCHNCGAANAESDEFCYNCGTAFAKEEKTSHKNTAKIPKFVWKKQYTLMTAGIVSVLVLIVLAVTILLNLFASPSLIYVKDNEMNIFTGKESYIAGEDIFADKDDIYTLDYSDVQISDDKKYIFYPQEIEDAGYELYRAKMGKSDTEVKIDNDVRYYYVLSSSDVVYLKDSKVYYSDLKDKRKIASDVSHFRVSEDNKYIMWATSDDKAYVQDIAGKNSKIKLDSDIETVYAWSADFNRIIYTKEDNLYLLKNFEEKEKIASDVESVSAQEVNGNFEIYYTIIEEEGLDVALSDIVDDDYAAGDANIVEPDIRDYQKKEVKNSYWGPIESVTTDDAYYDAVEKYEEKLGRDSLREELKNIMSFENKKVYYYSEKENESELLLEGEIIDWSISNSAAVFSYFDAETVEKVSLGSLINATYDEMEKKLEETILSGVKVYMYKQAKQIELDIDLEEYKPDNISFVMNEERNTGYLLLTTVDGESRSLFETDYVKEDGSLELIAEEVNNIELVNANGIYYITDVDANSNEGTLYLNDERVDDDVRINSVKETYEDKIFYMTDMDKDYYVGTLNRADKTDSERILDDVAEYEANENGEIALLVDYNYKKYRGDLKLYKNKKIESVDSDVFGIIGFY